MFPANRDNIVDRPIANWISAHSIEPGGLDHGRFIVAG